jgi:protein-S-isoprenylcysteine O-methyltransferase Ste14
MEFLSFFLAFLLWSLLHSVTAARSFKAWARRRVGERVYAGFYRLFYNLVALVSFLPVLYLLATVVPATLLWRVPPPFDFLFLLLQGMALAGLLISVWQTDVWRFAGIRQVVRYVNGARDPEPPPTFIRRGTYSLVRHPLYFFSLLLIWFTPVMTLSILLFNLLATAYFYLGALHEERRLAAHFGDVYEQYREEVPAFIPFLRLGTGRS